jgi:hypothetical protein
MQKQWLAISLLLRIHQLQRVAYSHIPNFNLSHKSATVSSQFQLC